MELLVIDQHVLDVGGRFGALASYDAKTRRLTGIFGGFAKWQPGWILGTHVHLTQSHKLWFVANEQLGQGRRVVFFEPDGRELGWIEIRGDTADFHVPRSIVGNERYHLESMNPHTRSPAMLRFDTGTEVVQYVDLPWWQTLTDDQTWEALGPIVPTPDERYFLIFGYRHSVLRVADARSGLLVSEVPFPDINVGSLMCYPPCFDAARGRAWIPNDKYLCVFDYLHLQLIQQLRFTGDFVLSPDGRRCYQCYPRDGEIRIMDTETFEVVDQMDLSSHGAPLQVGMHPDSKCLWVRFNPWALGARSSEEALGMPPVDIPLEQFGRTEQ